MFLHWDLIHSSFFNGTFRTALLSFLIYSVAGLECTTWNKLKLQKGLYVNNQNMTLDLHSSDLLFKGLEWIFFNFKKGQGFIQALLLTSVFHEGSSFMVIGHNPTCISTLTRCSWVFIWGTGNPSCGVQWQCPWKLWLFHWSQVYKYPFHASFGDLIFAFFKTLFSFVRLAWWLHLPTTTH